jgi:NAD(P)-dependent dehydrogenase (short-subunit alcohol dehydrogenase family)
MANREINATLQGLRQTGAQVEYLSLDVRNTEELHTALASIRNTYGPIKGIIHGAGTLADRMITAKTLEQFTQVFDTKVVGLHALLNATRDDDLKQIVLFSSVAARTGNRGQVDYAMANEVLNKVAWQESRRRPACKVTAINWGPWDGGMVTSTLKKEFQRNHVPLIDIPDGARALVMEMAAGFNAPAEIVVGGMVSAEPLEPPSKQPTSLSLSFKREIDLETVPVLGSHMLDGKPVVPLALMTEWFGHGALHQNPGLVLQGFDDLRVLKGIRLNDKKKLIRLMAGKAAKNGSTYEVPVELRDGVNEGVDVIHSNARAILSDALPPPPIFKKPLNGRDEAYFRSITEVYEKILFHGSDLRGIEEVISLSSQGMVARIASAPDPEKWMTNPHRTRWIGDPLALDCAFQMASLWCYEETGSVSLPSYCASYRQYTRVFPSSGLTAVLVVTAQTDRKLRADITLLDANEVVVAQIKGYEAVMDTSLIKAFKPQLAATA